MATYEYISPDGVIVPDTADIKSGTEQEWKDVFGEDLDVSDETPQGMMIGQEVAVRSEMVANNAALANQVNPNVAGGIFLDDLWALTGGKRRTATYTTIYNVDLSGAPGAIIPSGSRRMTTNGDVFELISTVVLDSVTGMATGTFQALEAGPVVAPADSLTVPVAGYTSIGWETSSNPQPGITGTSAQSDISARRERKETLALQGRSIAEAVYSNVRALTEVLSLAFRENTADSTQVIDGITLVEHSVWACVDGGTDIDVATALYEAKTAGAAWNGVQEVTVTDRYSGQTSVVKFDRPTAVPVMVRFTLSAVGNITDPSGTVRTAVLAYVNGSTDEEGFKLGTDVSPFELAAAANLGAPGMFITKVEVAPQSVNPQWTTSTLTIGLNQKATLTADNIIVVVPQ